MSIYKLQHRRLYAMPQSKPEDSHSVDFPVEVVKRPSVQIEASCHRACPSAVSTSLLARNSSDSTGRRVRSSCAGFHNDACDRGGA